MQEPNRIIVFPSIPFSAYAWAQSNSNLHRGFHESEGDPQQ